MRVTINGHGVLQGATLTDATTGHLKCYRFSRVPFALPPTGERRWRKPLPLPATFSYGSQNSPGKYDTRLCSVCPQAPINGPPLPMVDEDCLQCNIYIPIGEPPNQGWPVLFYIHGGFLQFGSNNTDDPSALLAETEVKCIIVSPGYRLGILGYLSSRELCGYGQANYGFWDQRLALEWTYENIQYFGGNKENISVGGLSAGSYAAFHQLAYDMCPQVNKQIIRRVFQWSNGCGVQPKRISEAQEQFENLLSTLKIPSTWDSQRKLDSLRAKSAEELIAAVLLMKEKFFRPVLDGVFVQETLFSDVFNGNFGERMRQLGIQTMIGDLTQEFHLYRNIFPPDSYEALLDRLSWDYPRQVAVAICAPYVTFSFSSRSVSEWQDIFGKIYCDINIHATMRGFLKSMESSLPLSYIYRYRIDWRSKAVDKRYPLELGATHSSDMAIWFFGNGDSLTNAEKSLIREWLKPVAAFIRGERIDWGTKSLEQVRFLTSQGTIEIRDDDIWNEKIKMWETIKKATGTSFSPSKAIL